MLCPQHKHFKDLNPRFTRAQYFLHGHTCCRVWGTIWWELVLSRLHPHTGGGCLQWTICWPSHWQVNNGFLKLFVCCSKMHIYKTDVRSKYIIIHRKFSRSDEVYFQSNPKYHHKTRTVTRIVTERQLHIFISYPYTPPIKLWHSSWTWIKQIQCHSDNCCYY